MSSNGGATSSASGNAGNLMMSEMKMNVRQTLNKSRLSPAVANGQAVIQGARYLTGQGASPPINPSGKFFSQGVAETLAAVQQQQQQMIEEAK